MQSCPAFNHQAPLVVCLPAPQFVLTGSGQVSLQATLEAHHIRSCRSLGSPVGSGSLSQLLCAHLHYVVICGCSTHPLHVLVALYLRFKLGKGYSMVSLRCVTWITNCLKDSGRTFRTIASNIPSLNVSLAFLNAVIAVSAQITYSVTFSLSGPHEKTLLNHY